MSSCGKCGGLVVTYHEEDRCINCGAYYFPPEPTGEICSQGGTCGRAAEMDGLCAMHHAQRMLNVNKGRAKAFKYRR